MPNDGATWESDLAGRIGGAVAARRKQLLLTVASLSARTRKLGHPIGAATISKIETNERGGTLNIAELLMLAAALEIPPVLLVFPGFPDGVEEVLPGVTGASDSAARWLSGADGLRGPVDDESDRGLYATSGANAGIALVELVNEVRQRHLDDFSLGLEDDGEPSAARAGIQRRLAALPAEIADARTDLWGDGTQPSGR